MVVLKVEQGIFGHVFEPKCINFMFFFFKKVNQQYPENNLTTRFNQKNAKFSVHEYFWATQKR